MSDLKWVQQMLFTLSFKRAEKRPVGVEGVNCVYIEWRIKRKSYAAGPPPVLGTSKVATLVLKPNPQTNPRNILPLGKRTKVHEETVTLTNVWLFFIDNGYVHHSMGPFNTFRLKSMIMIVATFITQVSSFY